MIRSFTLLFLSFILSLPFTALSQQRVNGLYTLSSTNIPVNDAFVYSTNMSFTAYTNESGFVDLRKLRAQVEQITISRIGFQTKIINLDELVIANGNATINLSPKFSSLEDVTIRTASDRSIFRSITDLDIQLRPINNSQEVLRIIPGLFIGQHAGGGKAEQLFLRGFDLDHGTDINITVDGMPVNMVSHAHGQGYADLHFVIPELIDKVNFNKGPYFADKGNFTTAGFVDFKTRDYLEKNFIKIEGGQFNTFRGITGVNLLKPVNGQKLNSLYFAGEASYTRGYFDAPQNFNRFNALLKYHGNISPSGTVTALVSGFKSKWNASGQIPKRSIEDGSVNYFGAIDNTEGGKTSRYNASVELLNRLNGGGVVRNQVYYTNYDFELYSNFTFYKEDSINGDQIRQKELRNIFGYSGSYEKRSTIGNIKTQTIAGAQIRIDLIDNIELSRTKNRSIITLPIQLGNITEANAGAHLSQKFEVNKRLDVTAAVRYDYFDNRYNNFLSGQNLKTKSYIVSPKLNFNYYLNNKVQLYWYNGKGFHSNDTRVAVVEGARKTLPPAWGTDVGGILKISKKLIVQSALWYLWLGQEFVYVGDEGVVEAGGKTRRMGADASIRYEIAKSLFADIDINVTSPKALHVAKDESNIPLAPKFTSLGGLVYRKEAGLNGSLRYRFMSDRPANEDNSVVAKGYCIIDAAINYNTKKWEAGFSIQNLLNQKWKETQFDTESRLQNEPTPVSEIHFTPGSPFFARLDFLVFF